MPRQARIVVPGLPLHITHRGHNRQPCFFCSQDFQIYLDWLGEHSLATGCVVHAYVLMTNHVHLLLSIPAANAAAALMKSQAQRYAQYVNRRYHRSGALWEGRFHSCATQQERYFLACQRYIELNPVRAGMVAHPALYRWSSYRANALGEPTALVQPHAVYDALGADSQLRLRAYRALFYEELGPGMVDQIRSATAGNFALGDPGFVQRMATELGRKIASRPAGRPPGRSKLMP